MGDLHHMHGRIDWPANRNPTLLERKARTMAPNANTWGSPTPGSYSIDPKEFALFLGITVAEAGAILKQERQELAATGDPDIHDGFNYRTQQWVTA